MSFVLGNYLHYLAFALLLAALAVELVLFRPETDGRTARKLAVADAVYGLAALLVLVTGLYKVFVIGKPAAYYGHNFLFHIKVTLFVVVALLSIYPTVQFVRRRKVPAETAVHYPAAVRVLLRVEIVLLLVIPLLAVMMGHGYGFSG